MFKKDPIKYKQPQEYYCSNQDCFNESADNSPLRSLLTDDVLDSLSDFYCIDCIIEGRTDE